MSSHVPAILLLSLILAQILPQHLVGAEGESSLSQKWSYLKGHRLGTSLREQFQHGPQFPVDSLTRGLREGALGVKSHMTVAEMREVVNEAMKRYVQAKQSAVSASSDGAVVQAPKAESASPAEVSFRESVGYVTGRTTLYVRSWKDIDDGDLLLVSPQTGAASAYTLAYSYTSVDTGVDNPDTDDARPRTLTESIAGTVVSRTYHVYAGSLSSGIVHIVERAADNSSSYGATGNLRTTITYYPSSAGSASAGRVKTIRFPDGRLDTYVYESGVYSDSVDPSLCSFSSGAGDSLRATVTHGTVTYPAGIANRTTRERSVLDAAGNQVMDETHVFSGGTTYERIGWTVWVYDARGRLTHTYRSNGTEAQVEWDCCGKSRDVFADGTDYTYVHDEVGRVEITIKENADDPDIIQTHTRNGAGAILSTVTVADNTTLALSTSSTRDLTGRATQRVDPAGVTTTTVYDDTDNKTTVTNAAGGAAVVQRYVSGQTKSVTGTAVTDAYYDYGVDATTGHRWTCIYAGEMPASNDFTDIPMWTKTWTDVLGRTFKVEVPDPTDGTAVSQSYFNALGRLVRTTVPGKADAIYEYNELGELTRVGLDIDDDGDLTEASLDRIADTDTVYEKDASNVWWLKTTSAVFPTDNSSTDVTVSTTRARLTGLGSTAPTAYSGILAAESSVEDIHGNITVSRTYIDRANKTVWSVTDVPDSTTDVVSETVNGMLVQETSPSGHTNHLLYDALERPVGVTDPRISSYDAQAGTWSNVYETGYNGYGQVNWTKDPEGNQTTYGYDSTTGLQTSVTDALSKVKNVHHDLRGLVLGTWGAAAQPKYYEYDEFGRMTKLHTLRDDSVTISSYKSFATNSGSFDTTTWTYQSSTGLMTAKTHADGKGTTYAYDSAGRLATRTWARTVGGNALATTYGYDDASGQLVSIDYSDATTRLAYTYDRLGRTRTVTDATGSRSFAYNSNLQLSTETLGSPFYASKILTRLYQGAADVPGRYEGLQAGTSQDPDADLDATHEYDASGRIHATAWTVASVSRKAGYSYDANSDLVEGYAVPEGGGVTISTATVFEDHRDLIESVQNGWGTTTTSKYEYTNDDIARRTDVVMTGDEFDTDVFNHYAYSDRSEVTAANRYNGTDITDTSSPVTAYDYDFDYDPIGNRKTRAVAGTTTTYTTDQLNQYTAVTSLTNPTYDPDGNMTLLPSPSGGGAGGGGWLCQWNAENRLVSATTTDAKLEFVYDYMGRRVRKKVHSGTTENWTEDSDTIYVYDGWNVVLELNANSSNATIKTYVWGLDLSQTLQGAGGVGGLLVVVENDATNSPRYYPLYDANGNVSEYLDSTGGVAAHYEYSPFGDLTATTGAKAADFAHRFSTKYLDTETNLYYYGSRYYTPELGRWLSRDPIGERGGYNLYGFVGNSPLVYTDLNGLFPGVAYLLDMYVELAVRTGNESVAAAAATTSTYARLLLPDPVHITHGAWARFVGYKELQFTNRTAAGLVVGTSVPGGGIVFRGFELNDGVCLEPNGFADQLDKEGKDSRKLLIGGEGLLIGTYVMGTIGLDVNLGGPHIFRTPCSNSTRRPRARHHTNRQGANGIDADGAVDPARGNPRGVDVEVEPFGPTKPGLHGPKAETGAAAEGAYVEFDLPDSAISTNVGPRNTARIPTNEPLPIRNLNPTIVKPPWWKFW